VEARPPGQSGPDFGVSVGRVAVKNGMAVGFRGRLPVDDAEEGEEFLMAVTFAAFARNLAGRHVRGRERRNGPVGSVGRVRSRAWIRLFPSTDGSGSL